MLLLPKLKDNRRENLTEDEMDNSKNKHTPADAARKARADQLCDRLQPQINAEVFY